MTDEPTPQTDETDDVEATVRISLGDHIEQIAQLVDRVHKRYKIPHGTAFQVVAFGIQDFQQRAEAADRVKQLAALASKEDNVQ